MGEEEFIRPEGCFAEARQNKTSTRKSVQAELKKLSSKVLADKSQQICQHLLSFSDLTDAGNVVTFSPLSFEPDINPLFSADETSHITFCFPKIEGKSLGLYAVDSLKKLKAGKGKLLEPDPKKCEKLEIDDIDVVLVPGLAFAERSGGRLGRGGGYYDRVLADEFFNGISIGICFDLQVQDTLPLEPHDELVDGIVTERGANMVH